MAAEAIVVGGGVMGLAAARELRRVGYGVTLLEKGQPGRAASWASAGIIGATLRHESDPSVEMRRVSRQLWPSFADALHAESGLDPEYRETGCIHLAASERELEMPSGVAQSLVGRYSQCRAAARGRATARANPGARPGPSGRPACAAHPG